MSVTILNFDQVYEKQSFLKKQTYDWVDFQSTPNTNLFCEKDTLQEIANQLERYETNKLTLIGSGNYHYITYLQLSKIKNPFTLILFDHHTDTLKSPSDNLISCGSWVRESLENLPNLNKVLIIGVSEDGEQHIPSSIEGRVRLYPKHYLRQSYKKSLESIRKEISSEEVYVSIDKDVLDLRDAMTGWDHGTMRLRQLLHIVKEIFKHNEVTGVDICGEFPQEPKNEFHPKTKEANDKNSYANQLLLTYILNWMKQADQPIQPLHASLRI